MLLGIGDIFMQLSRGSPTCLEKHFIISLTVIEDARTPPRRMQTTQAKTMQTLGDPGRATVLNIPPEASLFTSRKEQLPNGNHDLGDGRDRQRRNRNV
jgi:hypothetical protein